MTAILSLTLAPPSTATSGRSGSSSSSLERPHLALEQQPRGTLGHQPRDALGRGVRAVRGAEGVVDVHVGELRQRRRELGVVARLARLVADVLEHQHVAGVEVLGERAAPPRRRPPGASVTSAPVSSASRSAAGRIESSGSRSFGRPRCETSISAAPRPRSSSIVGSAARIRVSSATAPSFQRDIEVDPDQHPLSVAVAEILERPHSSLWTSSTIRFE